MEYTQEDFVNYFGISAGPIRGRKGIEVIYTSTKLTKAAGHLLAAYFIEERRIWRDRLLDSSVAMPFKSMIREAVAQAELQALTKDVTGEALLINFCERIKTEWPGGLTLEELYADNPEPFVIKVARIAALIPKAKVILQPLLESLLQQQFDGTSGWKLFGTVTECRVRPQEALGVPSDVLADYGRNRGLRWMLSETTNGWFHWYTGNPWYMIFNDVIAPLGWDVRSAMSTESTALRKAFDAAYYFPFRFQLGGVSPLVGEEADKYKVELAGGPKWKKPYPLYTGHPSRWRGTTLIDHYMRTRARNEVAGAVHFDELFNPAPMAEVPAMPSLPVYQDWLPYCTIVRGEKMERLEYYGPHPSIDGSHIGSGARQSEVFIKS